MSKKEFKVSYQIVKNMIVYASVFIIFWMMVYSFRDLILDSILKYLVGLSDASWKITLLIFYIYFLLYFVIEISKAFISLVYERFVRDHKYYGSLTHSKLIIPVTNEEYNKIKDNKLFFDKVLKDVKPEFRYNKVEKWARKIIEKEIKNLKEEGCVA